VNIRFLNSARHELDEAIAFYELNARGLGMIFFAKLTMR